MDYFIDVLAGNIAVALLSMEEMNEGLPGLERHEGE